MFLHEYFVVVSIAAVMNAVDFLWGIVVGLVLACIIMVVNVSRCCKRRAWHAHDRAALQRDSVRQVVSGAVDPLRPHNALDDRALVCTPGLVWCSHNTRALTHSRHAQPHWCGCSPKASAALHTQWVTAGHRQTY